MVFARLFLRRLVRLVVGGLASPLCATKELCHNSVMTLLIRLLIDLHANGRQSLDIP